jgi:hypothetical protein
MSAPFCVALDDQKASQEREETYQIHVAHGVQALEDKLAVHIAGIFERVHVERAAIRPFALADPCDVVSMRGDQWNPQHVHCTSCSPNPTYGSGIFPAASSSTCTSDGKRVARVQPASAPACARTASAGSRSAQDQFACRGADVCAIDMGASDSGRLDAVVKGIGVMSGLRQTVGQRTRLAMQKPTYLTRRRPGSKAI